MSDVYLHPEMATILAGGGAAPDYPNMPLAEARTTFERLAANWNTAIPALGESRDLEIPTAGGPMRARLLRPTLERSRPVIVFVHGGGWTFGSIDTHRGSMARLAIESDACVLGIDYRCAPEHPCPSAIDDTLDALDAVRAGFLGDAVDPSRIGLAGDSAGAGISLGVLTAARGRNRLRAAALFYGCYVPVFDTPSHAAFGGGAYLLTTARMRWYWANCCSSSTTQRRTCPCDKTCSPVFPAFRCCRAMSRTVSASVFPSAIPSNTISTASRRSASVHRLVRAISRPFG
jgi:acetyl esterase